MVGFHFGEEVGDSNFVGTVLLGVETDGTHTIEVTNSGDDELIALDVHHEDDLGTIGSGVETGSLESDEDALYTVDLVAGESPSIRLTAEEISDLDMGVQDPDFEVLDETTETDDALEVSIDTVETDGTYLVWIHNSGDEETTYELEAVHETEGGVDDADDATEDETDDSKGEDMPGFGGLVALVSIVAVVGYRLRKGP